MRSSGSELIRLGSDAVFRLSTATIARVAPFSAAWDNARKQIAVSRWLTSVGYPVTTALPVAQPVKADGRVVTFWESVAAETIYAPIGEVADFLRRLHELTAPPGLDLPVLRPFGSPDDPVPTFEGLAPCDAELLHERYAWARNAPPPRLAVFRWLGPSGINPAWQGLSAPNTVAWTMRTPTSGAPGPTARSCRPA